MGKDGGGCGDAPVQKIWIEAHRRKNGDDGSSFGCTRGRRSHWQAVDEETQNQLWRDVEGDGGTCFDARGCGRSSPERAER